VLLPYRTTTQGNNSSINTKLKVKIKE